MYLSYNSFAKAKDESVKKAISKDFPKLRKNKDTIKVSRNNIPILTMF